MRIGIFKRNSNSSLQGNAKSMRIQRFGFWGAVCLSAGLSIFSSNLQSADGQPTGYSGPGCVPGVIALSPSYQVPCDYVVSSADEEEKREAYYRFAWNTFFALNWPAKLQQPDGATRGMPNAAAEYSSNADTNYTPVWDTWRGKRELFRIKPVTDDNYIWDIEDPGVFNAVFDAADPNTGIKACSSVDEGIDVSWPILEAHKITNLIDETDEINLAVVWQNSTQTPDEESLVRYQVKFNAPHWNYIRNNQLYQTAAFTAFVGQKKNSKLGAISLPESSNSNVDTSGSILTKSAWIMLSDSDDDGTYYTTKGLYYLKVKEDQDPCFKVATFGLIALHIIRKTVQSPFFFFSTFEHKGNYPDSFYYANTIGPSGDEGSPPASTLKSGYGIPYEHPANPVFGVAQEDDLHKYQAKRLIDPSSALNQVNEEADAINQNAASVWQNYQLVGIQHTPVNGRFGQVDPDPTQDFFLANPVVETNQRFQYFDGKFGQANINNIATQPGITSAATVNMGGCMGCHGVAQLGGADFSFSLASVASAPTQPSAAEALAEKCQEINLVFRAAHSSCVRKVDAVNE